MQQSKNSILNDLIGQSSNFLLMAMILSFLLMFGVQMFYYTDLYKDIMPNIGFAYGVGISFGLFTQSVRFAFGLAGAYEFSNGNYGSGTVGLLFSFCITLFEAFEVQSISTAWGGGNVHLHDSLLLMFQFLIWTGFCLELRLAMNVSSQKTINEYKGKGGDDYAKGNGVTFSENGTAKRKQENSRS